MGLKTILEEKERIIIMEKRVYKSVRDRKVFGVCGGLGEYFNIDPMIFRLGFVILVLAFGTGILAYIVCGLVMSDDPEPYNDKRNYDGNGYSHDDYVNRDEYRQ